MASDDEKIRIAVHETLLSFGIDPRRPIEVQKNWDYLTKLRRGSEEVKRIGRNTAITTCVGAVVSAFLYMLATRLGVPIKLD